MLSRLGTELTDVILYQSVHLNGNLVHQLLFARFQHIVRIYDGRRPACGLLNADKVKRAYTSRRVEICLQIPLSVVAPLPRLPIYHKRLQTNAHG